MSKSWKCPEASKEHLGWGQCSKYKSPEWVKDLCVQERARRRPEESKFTEAGRDLSEQF